MLHCQKMRLRDERLPHLCLILDWLSDGGTVLLGLGVRPGDRVATLAMNSDRHLEAYYAIPGTGTICHTINPRLAADDICYIIERAEDRAENRIGLR